MKIGIISMTIIGLLTSSAVAGQYDRTLNFPKTITGHTDPRTVTRTLQICLPETTEDCDRVVVDTDRTSSDSSVPSPHGNAGPGYGINVTSWNDPRGRNTTSHSIGGNCLTSTVTVERRRRMRGWYEGKHTIYGKCVKRIEPPVESDLKPGEVYQHSAKILCGSIKDDFSQLTSGILAVPGIYVSTVNVHNPSYKEVSFRWKSVPAGRAEDAGHSKFTHGKIAADNAQFFDCGMFSRNPLEPFDGYFVIEADNVLDVNTYYSATDEIKEGRLAIDIEPVKERISEPGTDWKCQRRTSMNLGSAKNWFIDDNQNAVLANPIPGRPGALSYQLDAGATGDLPTGNYPFELDLCLCGTDGKDSIARIDWNGQQKTDDGLVLIVDRPSPEIDLSLVDNQSSINDSPPNLPSPNATFLTKMGTHTVRATVYNKKSGTPGNVGNLMTFTPKGTVTITNGYPGVCLQDQ